MDPGHLLDSDHFFVCVIGAELLHLQDILSPLEFFRVDKKQRLLDTVLVSVITYGKHPCIEGNATPVRNNWILSQKPKTLCGSSQHALICRRHGKEKLCDTEWVNRLTNHFVSK